MQKAFMAKVWNGEVVSHVFLENMKNARNHAELYEHFPSIKYKRDANANSGLPYYDIAVEDY